MSSSLLVLEFFTQHFRLEMLGANTGELAANANDQMR